MLLPHLHLDEQICISSTFISMMSTAAHILIRFVIFLHFPAKLWTLSKQYNSGSVHAAILDFLEYPVEYLDVGYSLPLQAEALDQGTLEEQIRLF